MIFENYDRIVFAGDSVTDMGSAQPVGEGLFDNVGRGYVREVHCMGSCASQSNRCVTDGKGIFREM